MASTSGNQLIPNKLNPNNPIHGGIYQTKLLMYFAYRGLCLGHTFSIASEQGSAKKFDDLIYEFTVKECKMYRLLQAKHTLNKQDSKKLTATQLLTIEDGPYSLVKYFFSYQELKKENQFREEHIQDLILFTNIGLDVSDLGKNNITIERIKEDDDILNMNTYNLVSKTPLRYRFGPETIKTLKPALETFNLKKLARRLVKCLFGNKNINHWDPNDVFSGYHLILAKEVIDVRKKRFKKSFLENEGLLEKTTEFRKFFEEELRRESSEIEIKNLNDAMDRGQVVNSKKIGLKLISKFGRNKKKPHFCSENWPGHGASEEDVRDFLDHLVFAVSQPNEDELGKILKRGLGEHFSIGSENDIDTIYCKFKVLMLALVQGKIKPPFLSSIELRKWFDEKISRPIFLFDAKDPVALFTGRLKQLASLHKRLQSLKKSAVVTGIGGIGKSQLVKMYIKKYNKDYDSRIIWLNAESHQTLAESFERLANERLNISTKIKGRYPNTKSIKSIVEDVFTYFSTGKSLFVFDNAGKFAGKDGIIEFLPPTALQRDIYVVITSRYSEWENIPVLALGQLTKSEATDLIKKILSLKSNAEDNEVQRLAETMQCFPLALQQAGTYIKARDSQLKTIGRKFDIKDYLAKFDEGTKTLLNFKCPKEIDDRYYTKTTFTTWTITIDQIKNDPKNGCKAFDILNIMSFLGADNIPTRMFLKFCDNEELLASAIKLLKQYSIVSCEQDPALLNIHRVLQLVTRLQLKTQKEDEKQSLVKACELVVHYYSTNISENQNFSVKQKFVPHLEAILKNLNEWCSEVPCQEQETLVIPLLNVTSEAYYKTFDYQRAFELQKRALKAAEILYGSDHDEVGHILDSFGNTLRARGKIKKSKIALERALVIRETKFGPNHLKVAGTLTNLGITLQELGDYNKAEEMLMRALRITEEKYGFENIKVAPILNNLGKSSHELGYFKEAKEFFDRALRIKEAYYGPKHIFVAGTLYNLGITQRELGEYNKAQGLQELALQIQETHLGSDHIEVADTLKNLAKTLRLVQEHLKAKQLLERALEIQETHYGPEHLEVASLLKMLGDTLRHLDDHQKAKQMLERALKIQETHYGLNHIEITFTLNILMRQCGEYLEAETRALKREKELRIQRSQRGERS